MPYLFVGYVSDSVNHCSIIVCFKKLVRVGETGIQLQHQPNLQVFTAQKSSLNVWKKGNQMLALASGGAFLGGLIAQVPGAMIGAIIAAVYGYMIAPETN